MGLGLRWLIARRLSLALDGAQVVEAGATTARDMRRVHVTLVLQF